MKLTIKFYKTLIRKEKAFSLWDRNQTFSTRGTMRSIQI